MKTWNVYCSGEIHTNWRKLLSSMVKAEQLPIELTSPNCNHEESDAVGDILDPICEEPTPEPPMHYGENDKKYLDKVANSQNLEYLPEQFVQMYNHDKLGGMIRNVEIWVNDVFKKLKLYDTK